MHRLSKRLYATAVNAATTSANNASLTPLVIKNNRIFASVILSRAPQITRDSTPFERAYFDYKEKLERQQASSFPTEFYFKKGSLAERRWKDEENARRAAMTTDLPLSDVPKEEDPTTKADKAARTTEADQTKNVKSLDRALQRTLYLVLKDKEGWRFPQGQLDKQEYLHEAAERSLKEDCGPDMDTWLVGRQPVSFFKQSSAKAEQDTGLKVKYCGESSS